MSRKPSPKAKAFAKAFADFLMAQRETARKNGNGKAPYAPTPQALLPIGVAMCDAPIMPSAVFYGTAGDRRAWCVENDIPVLDVADICEKVGARCDNTFRARLHAWQDLDLISCAIFYTRERALSKFTENDTTIYVYRCEM